jgi:hypothetical protein
MKTKINICILGFVLATSVFISACSEDFLDRAYKDRPATEGFLTDEASARKLAIASFEPWTRVNLGYMHFKEFIILCDALTDDSDIRLNGSYRIQMRNWDFLANHEVMRDWWKYIYQSVNAANYAIQQIPTLVGTGDLTQEKLDPYIAMARFMRAYDYLVLTTFYGDVPLIDHPLSSFSEYFQPRSSVELIYEQIISDFAFAKEKLLDNDDAYKGTPTKSTAAAFLAKAYLYEKDYPNAEIAAREAVTMAEANGYALIDDFMSIFDIANEGNPELLFYFAFDRNNDLYSTTMSVERGIRDIPGELRHIQGGEGWGYALPDRGLYDAFEPGDPRREYTIFAPGDFFGIYQNANPFTYTHKMYDGTGTLITYDKTYNTGDTVRYDFQWSPTGMSVRKLTENVGGLTNVRYGGIDIPVMRMADLYLILAEALAEQGDDEALDWVNAVRARASVDMPAKTIADGTLIDIVRQERRVEFGMEGQRIFDLLRWDAVKAAFGDGTKVKLHFNSDYLTDANKYRNPTSGLSKYPTDHILFPIPQDELDQNPMITTNNPGY